MKLALAQLQIEPSDRSGNRRRGVEAIERAADAGADLVVLPELYRRLVDAGTTLTLVPSAWPYPRVEHWQLLPRARAVENLMYVAAANGTGSFDEADLLGRSTVYDPWGRIVASTDDAPDIVTATLDPERVANRRAEFPALQDRRR